MCLVQHHVLQQRAGNRYYCSKEGKTLMLCVVRWSVKHCVLHLCVVNCVDAQLTNDNVI